MIKKIICIDCPKGCFLKVVVDNGKIARVSGYKCPKGKKYAASEIENPRRVLTSTVSTLNLSLRMIPVRTDRPIPKPFIMRAMKEIKKININQPLKAGDIIIKDILKTGANLIATRDCME